MNQYLIKFRGPDDRISYILVEANTKNDAINKFADTVHVDCQMLHIKRLSDSTNPFEFFF